MADPKYRVVPDGDPACAHCGAGQLWTVISGHGDDEFAHTSACDDREVVDEECELMNDAYNKGLMETRESIRQELLNEMAEAAKQ